MLLAHTDWAPHGLAAATMAVCTAWKSCGPTRRRIALLRQIKLLETDGYGGANDEEAMIGDVAQRRTRCTR